ncbi:MAG: tRNA (guanine(6)-N2)-methyltransferase [Thermoprotei archaeon]
MYEYYATTNIGLEYIAANELQRTLSVYANPLIGIVRFNGSLDLIYKVNLLSRTIHKVILLIGETDFNDIYDIYKFSRYLSYTNHIERNQSFAVRVERIGNHPFNSMQVAERVGRAVIESFMSETGHRLKVNLDFPDVEIFCRVRENHIIIGVNTTGESLHKRGYRIYNHPAALSTTIAASMIYISEWNVKQTFLDPMCGGGTIPIEAALIARKIPLKIFRERSKIGFAFEKFKLFEKDTYEKISNEAMKSSNSNAYSIYGIDISQKYLSGAMRNAESANVLDTIKFIKGDSRKLENILNFTPEIIIVNPPYGRRFSNLKHIKKLYSEFLKSVNKVVKKSIIVAITAAPNILKNEALKNGFLIEKEYNTKNGNVPVKIIKIKV